MPNPVYGRLRVGGLLYEDASWSIGVNVTTIVGSDPFANLTTDVQGGLQGWADRVAALNSNQVWPLGLLNCLSSQGSIDYVRTSRVGTDGRETAVAEVILGTRRRGATDAAHQAQTAVCVSLLTGAPGASNRGRVYLPALRAPLAQGRLSAGDAGTIAGAYAAWLNDVANATNDFDGVADIKPAVVSTTQNRARQILTCRVGNRLDSQRRRAESQEEVYSVASVPQ